MASLLFVISFFFLPSCSVVHSVTLQRDSSLEPITGGFLDDLCSRTHDPEFCLRTIESDPRSKNADFLELAYITIDRASMEALATRAKVHLLYLTEKNPDRKNAFLACQDFYDDIGDSFQDAIGYLEDAGYLDANLSASEVNDDASQCEATVDQPPLKSPLTKENTSMELYAEILAVASNLL